MTPLTPGGSTERSGKIWTAANDSTVVVWPDTAGTGNMDASKAKIIDVEGGQCVRSMALSGAHVWCGCNNGQVRLLQLHSGCSTIPNCAELQAPELVLLCGDLSGAFDSTKAEPIKVDTHLWKRTLPTPDQPSCAWPAILQTMELPTSGMPSRLWLACSQICIFTIAESSIVRTMKPHTETVDAMVGVGTQVWSGSRDRTIVAHDANTLTALFSLGDQGAGVKALMSHSWYVWSLNFRNMRVYTAEAVWHAKVEEALRLMRELEATRQSLQAQIQQVTRQMCIACERIVDAKHGEAVVSISSKTEGGGKVWLLWALHLTGLKCHANARQVGKQGKAREDADLNVLVLAGALLLARLCEKDRERARQACFWHGRHRQSRMVDEILSQLFCVDASL
eukprot:scaffold9635_cov20-Tisochrysis_lutea.AAC.1